MKIKHNERQDVSLVVGGKSHDFDYVRLQLLNLLAGYPHVRTAVSSDFENLEALADAACVISYTCDVRPSAASEDRLQSFVEDGGRWLALHATNSFLEWTEQGVRSAHDEGPFFKTLGSAFVAHPPIGEFTVSPTEWEHPLTEGIAPFAVVDELYLSEYLCEITPLLGTRFTGEAPGFAVDQWPDSELRPMMYFNPTGRGRVLFFALGHARGHWDAPHRTPYYPTVERGAWTSPAYLELLRRCVAWAVGDPVYDVEAVARHPNPTDRDAAHH